MKTLFMESLGDVFKPKSQAEVEKNLNSLPINERFMLECRIELDQWLFDKNISTQMFGEQHIRMIELEIQKTFHLQKDPCFVTEESYEKVKELIIEETKKRILVNMVTVVTGTG